MSHLATIKTFTSFEEALVACSALKAAGFEASVCDTNISAVYAHALDFALGGFRLQAPAQQAGEARLYLEDILSVPHEQLGEEDVDTCPQCGADDARRGIGLLSALLGFLQGVLALKSTKLRQCRICGARWRAP